MDINITKLVKDNENELISLQDYSASQAELGENAGRITWENALDATDYHFIASEIELEECKAWLKGFGAWEKEEIENWTNKEVDGLLLQFIAGDLRRYLKAKEEGKEFFDEYLEREGGSICEHDGEWFFTISE